MEVLELDDIQGLVVRGYKKMEYSRYLLLQVTNPAATAAFLKSHAGMVTSVQTFKDDRCFNIAFTASGLNALGLDEANILNFVKEFREGMVTEHRQRLLGDFDSSDPSNWRWGSPDKPVIHMIVMLFACHQQECIAFYDEIKPRLDEAGLIELQQLDAQMLPGGKEHFGYRDGISQPVIKGTGRNADALDMVNPGEFIMGYVNQYEVFPDTPLLTKAQGDDSLLSFDASGTGYKDLGRNGSYMVLRQLQEDVEGFWTWVNEKTKNEDGSLNEKESRKLAAKMMGRWPSGAPIIKWPDEDPVLLHPHENPDKFIDDNDFLFKDDPHGVKCPFGSHLRRTNPRDSFEDNDQKESQRLTSRHRIIRRARPYGEPVIGSPENCKTDGEVGLLFACFNADISRQFEFIQYTWANYPKFKQLYNDPDPFIGVRENPPPGIDQVFTVPGEITSKYHTGLKSFVTVKGGAYFFLPGISTIRFLASLMA